MEYRSGALISTKLVALAVLPLAAVSMAFGQTPRVEVGVQVGGIHETVLGEYPVGGGGRVAVHLFSLVDVEAEVNRYPIGGAAALFPATQMIVGARVGRRFGPVGIYGRAMPGLMRFDTNGYVANLGTRPALNLGGVLELYSRRHFAARLDIGDTAVWYGRDIAIPAISAPGPSTIPGTRHQVQFSFGVSAWF